MNTFGSIDAYIGSFPEEKQIVLKEIRQTITLAAPEAQETISYGMPTFKLNGNLVHFAMAKSHLGFYPGTSAILAFRDQILDFKHSKGGLQFPLDGNLPILLISDIVKFRVKENNDFRTGLSAPTKQALQNLHITSLRELCQFTEADLLKLHGVGKTSIPKLKAALKAQNLSFKDAINKNDHYQ